MTQSWDGADITGITNGEDEITNRYYRGIGLIASKENDVLNYYQSNDHGDITVWGNTKYSYDAFGNQESQNNDDNPFRYCGEYADVESGLIYLRARMYDPSTGRFINEDPIRDGLNWYIYCGGNPVMFVDPWGLAWTDEDQAAYDALGGFWSKEARNFKKEIDGATKDWENAKGDIYKENNAHYRAVAARQKVYANGYVDDFDYTRGQGAMTFLGVHAVIWNDINTRQYHTSIIVFASESSTLYTNENFVNSAYGGKLKYATLGAGDDNGVLRSRPNREKDVMLDIKKEMINLNVNSNDTINKLFVLESKFRSSSSVTYNMIPAISKGYNSNSFVHGLLNAAEISITNKPQKSVPGWGKPLPISYFD